MSETIALLERPSLEIESSLKLPKQIQQVKFIESYVPSFFPHNMDNDHLQTAFQEFKKIDEQHNWPASLKHLAKMILGISKIYNYEWRREKYQGRDLQEQIEINGIILTVKTIIHECDLFSASWQGEVLKTILAFNDRAQQRQIWNLYGNTFNKLPFNNKEKGNQLRNSVLMAVATTKAITLIFPDFNHESLIFESTEFDDADNGIDLFVHKSLNPGDSSRYLAVQVKSSARRKALSIPGTWNRNRVVTEYPLEKNPTEMDKEHFRLRSIWPERMERWQDKYLKDKGQSVLVDGLWIEYPADEGADMLSGEPQPDFIQMLRQALDRNRQI